MLLKLLKSILQFLLATRIYRFIITLKCLFSELVEPSKVLGTTADVGISIISSYRGVDTATGQEPMLSLPLPVSELSSHSLHVLQDLFISQTSCV